MTTEVGSHQQVSSGDSRRPWELLPPDALDALAPELPALTDEIIDAIATEVPAYARPLEGAFGQAVRRGVEQALLQFDEMARNPGVGRSAGRNVYVALGRGEVREGRTLEALLAAYRVGARIAWRRLAGAGLKAGFAPETLVLLAESIFAYIDELSAESAEGFAQEQAEQAGERDRRVQALIALLLREPVPEPAAVAAAAEAAHWRLPGEVAVVVWDDSAGRRAATRLPIGYIDATVERFRCAVVPDPEGPGRLDEILAALARTQAGVGPTVPWRQAGASFRQAAEALALAEQRGVGGPLVADEHRADLLLRADPVLVTELTTERLAPLAEETEASRSRLKATLLAWLRHEANVSAAARELVVHPQTVRYRLGKLRELFGDALDDPDVRFELEVALRAEAVAPGHE
jgi:PucR C-terminal helix-turn-helix domain